MWIVPLVVYESQGMSLLLFFIVSQGLILRINNKCATTPPLLEYLTPHPYYFCVTPFVKAETPRAYSLLGNGM